MRVVLRRGLEALRPQPLPLASRQALRRPLSHGRPLSTVVSLQQGAGPVQAEQHPRSSSAGTSAPVPGGDDGDGGCTTSDGEHGGPLMLMRLL